MAFGTYEAVRLLRAPLIFFGRRRHVDASDSEKWWLEHNAYRRAATKASACTAIDPHHFNRADLDTSSIVLDVGAYRGKGAKELRDLYGCQVYAFEPSPQFFADLEEKFAGNPNVVTLAYGLGSADATMVMQQDGPGSTVYGKPNPTVRTTDVQIRDVAAVLDELGHARIDYMKINIEGAEYDLLERMLETGWAHRVRYFLIQFHEWYGNAHLRRWRIQRQLRQTHDQVWNYPWIWELWCAKSQPHPEPPSYSRQDLAKIHAELKVQLEARAAAKRDRSFNGGST